MDTNIVILLMVLQVLLGVFISMVSSKTLGVRGIILAGVVLTIIFYIKDLYDVWCFAEKRSLLGPSWSNHSLVALGFILTSLYLTWYRVEKHYTKTVLVILAVLLVDVILDTIQDYAHLYPIHTP